MTKQDPSTSKLPLSGLRVLDLTLARSGPTCVRHLADWGADVIRIMPPDNGREIIGRRGSDYQNLHRNKRALTLDLKTPEGHAALLELVREADVLVENMRVGVKHRLKIAWQDLQPINPRLVYGSISGFGQTGPYSERGGVDQIAQGMGGLMSVTGEPGRGPMRVGIAVADMSAGNLLALAIMMALYERERTGLGKYVHTSLVKWIKIYRSNNHYSIQNYGYASDLTNVLELPDESIVAGGGVLLYNQILTPNTPPKLAPWLIRADSNGCISSDCGFIQDAVQKTTYFPIVSPSNEWTVEYSDFSFNTRRKYRFSLDSVFVNGYFHRELEYNDSFTGFHTTGRYYREKDGIVYNSFGHVLYNLNLGATDTLPSNQNLNPSTRTILSVGTVVLNDGLPRKTMKFQCDDEPIDTLTIVEGIGDLGEFFHAELQCINPLDGPGKTINCFSVNGEIVYKRMGEDCDLISTSHPINSEKPIIVYPNPTNGLLYLNLSNIDYNQIMQVHIYSSLGTLKLRQDLVKTNGLFSIETSDLNDGIYLGQVILGDGQVIPFEFVVMR